jgi:soluble lytic murein transglycosylase-like protein
MPSRFPIRRDPATLFLLLLVATTAVGAGSDDLQLPPPTFSEATVAWQDGRAPDALIALDQQLAAARTETPTQDPLPLEALVLRATLYGHLGRPQDAEADWQAVIEREPWMRTFARRALVTSLSNRGSALEAEPILAELSRADASRHIDLMLRVADTYRESGETSAARRLYQQVLDRQSRGEMADMARVGTAAAWERDGDVTAALAVLHEAKIHHRSPNTFEVAAAAERRLLAAHGGDVAPFSEPEYRTLVRRLRNASRFTTALALIDEWRLAHARDLRQDEIEFERVTTLYVQRANAAAVVACQGFYEEFPDSSHGPAVRLTDFRIAVRMVDTERARRLGRDLWEGRVLGATSSQRRDAATLLAAYLVAVGDVSGGLDIYRQLFESAPSADDQRALLWRAGVAALRDGQNERAVTNLRGLMGRDPSGDLAPAGLYWLGVAESRKDAVAGIRTLEAVAQRFPYHYYGMRARERLQQVPSDGDPSVSLGELTVIFPQLALNQGTEKRAEYRAAMVLARAGLIQDAAWYLRRLLADQRDGGLALLAARASADAGDYANVARILVNHFGRFLQEPARDLPDDFWTLVYPRPFWDDVRHAGTTHGVDPLFLVSLMRQESRFDPEARSTVGAIGLFQIMTYTAEALAPRAGVANVLGPATIDESVLAQPEVNAAIAARLAGDLFDLFDGAAAPVAASYNAGEERVAIWWATSRELTPDFFVDTIPYSETRRFVREVLANRAVYERIYGDQ